MSKIISKEVKIKFCS